MIPDRFSASSFESAGLDTPAARELADDLERTLQRLVDETLDKLADQITRELNDMGHNLALEPSDEPGQITYFDHDPDSTDWHQDTKLRLAIDSTVSAGYRHLRPPDSA